MVIGHLVSGLQGLLQYHTVLWDSTVALGL